MVGIIAANTPNYKFALVRFDAVGWQAVEHSNWKLVDSLLSLVIGLPSVTGIWENSFSYTIGDRTVDETAGQVYRCLVAHTSPSTGTFDDARTANPTYWQALTVTPVFTDDWSTGVGYSVADIVVVDTYKYYYCAAAHTAGVFATDLAANRWTLIWDASISVDAAESAADTATAAASTASSAASSATTSASTATTQADIATTAASTATTQASNASTSADTATSAASAAATDASDADTARIAAEAAASAADASAAAAAISAAAADASADAAAAMFADTLTEEEADALYAAIAHVGAGGTAHANATTSVAGFLSAADKTKLDALPITKIYTSAQQTYTIGGTLTLAHGLSGVPKLAFVVMRCVTAELGYSVNDEFFWTGQSADGDGSAGRSNPPLIVRDATNIVIRYSPQFRLPGKASNDLGNATAANWRAIFVAVA
jgi:hypothetical protein